MGRRLIPCVICVRPEILLSFHQRESEQLQDGEIDLKPDSGTRYCGESSDSYTV